MIKTREVTGVAVIDEAGKVCDRHGLINVGPTIAYEVATALLKLENRIAELEKRSLFLQALEESGVDNWYGYADAQCLLDEWGVGDDELGMQ